MRRHELRVYSEFSESDLMVFWLVGFSGHWACQVRVVEQCMDGSGAFVHLRAVQRGLGLVLHFGTHGDLLFSPGFAYIACDTAFV